MSHDEDDNPAEIYGRDGKIYYRSEGGAGVELGAGSSLWEDCVINYSSCIRPKDAKHIEVGKQDILNVDRVWIRRGGSGDEDMDITFTCEAGGGGGEHPFPEECP